MARAFVSVGSNIDHVRHLTHAIGKLSRLYGPFIPPLDMKAGGTAAYVGTGPRAATEARSRVCRTLDLMRLGEPVCKRPAHPPRPERRHYAPS
ncbi:MAG: hypothetical protein ACYCP0_00920 [Acidiferrobacteraceae bacterium]